jgi:hypothetical protein
MNPVEHYANLAKQSGWIEYVRHQVKEMEKDPSRLWVGLGQAIAQRLKNDANNIQS